MEKPPVAKKKSPRKTILHGETRTDDYFWMRERSDPDVRAYLEEENSYAELRLRNSRALRETLEREMRAHLKETDSSVPFREGDSFYYSRTEEGKQYPILCRRRKSAASPEEVTLDLNLLASGKPFLALGEHSVSPDGRLLAYSLDETGYREYTLRVKNLDTGEVLPWQVEGVTSAAWASDARTLFYSVENEAKRSYRVFRRAVDGEGEETFVYEEEDDHFDVDVSATRSRSFLLIRSSSHTCSEVLFLRADDPEGPLRPVVARRAGVEYDVDEREGEFYIRINDTGRNFRIVTAPASDPRPESWKERVTHRDDVMVEGVDCFAGFWALSEREAGLPQIRVVECPSGRERRIAFPEPAYDVFLTSNRDFGSSALRYSYESLVTPVSVFDYDVARGESVLRKRTEVPGYDPAGYRTERLFATATDGMRIPISLVYRCGARDRGPAPVLLYGYGAYGLSIDPGFNSNRLSLLDRGVVFAIAHVRGGGELGKAWHDAGRMSKKMNTFTDFIAAAEELVARGWTVPDRLAIEGRSAGGLLVGAVVNLRPDLFGAAVATVPFVDVINTMLDESLPLTVGEYEEWGDPRDPEAFRWMRAYSPYDNVERKGYPAMLLNSSFHDSQVPYWEPAKFAARLRARKTDDRLLLLKTNMDAGHGGSSGRYDHLKEIAFDQAFLLSQWGISA